MSGNPTEGVAVIGLACRFPGARDAEQFWDNLSRGVESISFFTEEELAEAGAPPAHLRAPNYVRASGSLADADLFDASFFGFSPREAEITDPQHRLFLECAWESLERAGYNPEAFGGPVGVFAGAGLSSYLLNIYTNRELAASVGSMQAVISNDKDYLATRVSYKLNLKGPSVTVQSACSTSLVAVHVACQSLLNYECDMALAGGSTVLVPSKTGYLYQEGGILSPDGHCRAFDAAAKGTVSGSGVGVVVLKRLADALADGDHVRAVVRGTAVNNDGSLKVGYTAPSVKGQAEVIALAQAVAGVEPSTVSYVEAHGTGTVLGDPIEIEALTQAFRAGTGRKNFCAVGSVKTNVGHLDTAAGVAGLIKTVLALEHRQLPPSLHYEEPNPRIAFDESPFYVNRELTEWKPGPTPRRAGVSSFGIGGTNAHAVLEEAPEVAPSAETSGWKMLAVSARTDEALARASSNLSEHLTRRAGDVNLADVAYTLQVGRKHFGRRRAIFCRDAREAAAALAGGEPRLERAGQWEGRARPLAFMFSGQGSQYVNMGLGLYHGESEFRRQVDLCAELLKSELKLDLRDVLYPREGEEAGAGEKLRQTLLTQPALFAVEYALAQTLIGWGLCPEVLIGHSLGEYVAACVAGVFSPRDALRLVVARARLMQELPGGAMVAVAADEGQLGGLLGEGISLAAVNGPGQCVLSGSLAAVRELEGRLSAEGLGCRRLEVSHAFHSEMMEPVVESVARLAGGVRLSAPSIPLVSNVTGRLMTAEEATDPSYWARHLRQTVRFGDGLKELLRDEARVLVEVGPGRALCRMAKRQAAEVVAVAAMREAKEQVEDDFQLVKALGELWVSGVAPEWAKFYEGEQRRRVELPTYPFERRRFWVERQRPEETGAQKTRPALAKQPDVADWFYVPSWRRVAPPPAVANGAAGGRAAAGWLVFADDSGLGARLIERLREAGLPVRCVFAGEAFAELAEDEYAVDPARRADYDALFRELYASGKMPRKIVHLWGVGPGGRSPADDLFDPEQGRGFFSLLYLAQAVGAHMVEHSEEYLKEGGLDVQVVTDGAQPVTGDEELLPERAAVLGLCGVIPQEYPGVACRNIDLPHDAGGARPPDRTSAQLYAELLSGAKERAVAYRGGHRWAQAFEPVRLEGAGPGARRLREGGVYLITGGLGGIALELAKELAVTARARLVLVGRTPLPPREVWDEVLTRDAADPSRRKVEKALALEAAGAEVLLCGADVADEARMREVVAEARARFGAVHGVIHAAGVAPQGLIQLKTREAAERVLAPKIKGARVLASVLADERLDFVVYCSSLRSFVARPGGSDYSAANLFLDALAQRQFARGGCFTVSINWDGWAEVGMSAAEAGGDAAEELLLPREGVEAFRRVLDAGLPQVVVSTLDLPRLVAENEARADTRQLGRLAEQLKARPAHPRPRLDTPYVAPRNETERAIAEIWQTLLGIEQVGVDDNFFELGGDSIISIQLTARINQTGLRLTPAQVFERQTVAELAAVAGTGRGVEAEQGLVTGALPLTPLQRRFLEGRPANPHHFNQSVLLEVRQPLDPGILESALRHLTLHHDALRLRLIDWGGEWQQDIDFDPGAEVPLTHLDLSATPEPERRAAVEGAAAEAQASLDLFDGPLMRVVLMTFGEGAPGRLLVVVHHFAVDVVSWRVLLEDLQTAYAQLSVGAPVSLPAKTTSYKRWAEQLAEHANSEVAEGELGYWLQAERAVAGRLPPDFPGGENTEDSKAVVSVTLDVESTLALLQEVPSVYRTQVNDVLLAALARTFESRTGSRSLVVDLEGHGREGLSDDVDYSRTVGWFTTVYPVLLDAGGRATPGDCLKAVKEQLRAVPRRGVGYGPLRYLRADDEVRARLSALPPAELSFLYLGQMDQAAGGATLFGPAPESAGPTSDPRQARPYPLEVVASVAGGRLRMAWVYSRNLHRPETVERLAEDYFGALRSIITFCLSSETSGYTPSDFTEAGLSQKDLDELIAELSLSEE